jgi:hypothetical protein
MSRSYKKVACKSDGSKNHPGYTKFAKGQANKKVRQYKGEIGDGSKYKLLYNPWNIRDWIWCCWDKDDEWYEKLKRK